MQVLTGYKAVSDIASCCLRAASHAYVMLCVGCANVLWCQLRIYE
jgi:hypothetical protein